MGTPLQKRVGQLIRLLSSEDVGEAGARVRALHNTLVNAGLDVHWPADVVVAALLKGLPEKRDDFELLCIYSPSLHRREEPGSKPTLCVRYHVDASAFSDWWAFEHDGPGREFAAEKWECLGGDLQVPERVDEAIESQDELCADLDRYWQIVEEGVREVAVAR
jgi:hypothetical protein